MSTPNIKVHVCYVDKVEDAIMYWTDVPRQCLQEGMKYLNRGSKEVVTVSAFNDGSERNESNILGYKDPDNTEPNLSVEELGPSGIFYIYIHLQNGGLKWCKTNYVCYNFKCICVFFLCTFPSSCILIYKHPSNPETCPIRTFFFWSGRVRIRQVSL